ncbi:MAG: hypothetical protein ABIT72_04620 [Burkholderiaceae bacterium]
MLGTTKPAGTTSAVTIRVFGATKFVAKEAQDTAVIGCLTTLCEVEVVQAVNKATLATPIVSKDVGVDI